MRLTIDGTVNKTYCQNLCLIFFPGAKFPEKEPEGEAVPSVFIRHREDGVSVFAEAVMEEGSRRECGFGEVAFSSFPTKDRAVRTAVGHAVLEAGEKLRGEAPPWGILTGVRPAKVASELLRDGKSREQVVDILKREYRVQGKKAILLAEVAEAEQRAAALAGPGTCSLYVSIPFCPTRCAYCSFVSYATPRYLATIPAYLDCLCEDILRVGKEISERGERILTVYIGGGTPTVLSAPQLDRLLKTVGEAVGGAELLEYTVEAGRPDTVTEEKLSVLLSHGVTRTSINPQILDDGILRGIGRRHTVAEFYRAYRMAQKAGIPSANTDLIAGLPGADSSLFAETVREILALSPENVTVHTYCVKRAASLTEEAAETGDRSIYAFSDGETVRSLDSAQEALMGAGYSPYYLYRQKNAKGNLENVGFTLPGKEGLYNIFMMGELQNIYAVGAGAVSKRVGGPGQKITRIFEPKYTYEYLKNRGKSEEGS